MCRFKLGIRVVVIRDTSAGYYIGNTGTITGYNSGLLPYFVTFDDMELGRDVFAHEELCVIEEVKPLNECLCTKYKVGDIVKTHYGIGTIVTITIKADGHTYDVEFKKNDIAIVMDEDIICKLVEEK